MTVDFTAFEGQLVAELERISEVLKEAVPAARLQILTARDRAYPYWLTGTFDAGNADKTLVVAVDVWTSSQPLPGQQLDAYRTKLECDVLRCEESFVEGPTVKSPDELSGLDVEFHRWSAEVLDFLRSSTPSLVSAFVELTTTRV